MIGEHTKRGPLSREEYLQVLALLVLGQGYVAKLRDVENAACDILQPRDSEGALMRYGDGSHVGDMMFEDRADVDELLRKMGLTVEEAPRGFTD